MTTPKRPPSMSDADRALRRHRTQPRGIPIETDVDQDLTPPPTEMPQPSSLKGYESIPPPIRDQIEVLSIGQRQLTEAIGKVWDVRHQAERFDQVDSKLATLAVAATRHETQIDSFLMPAIKELMAAVDRVATHMPMLSQQVEMQTALLSTMDGRLRSLEVDMRIFTERLQSVKAEGDERHASATRRLDDQDGRIDVLERKERDREVISRALVKHERRKSGVVGAAVAAIVSAIAAAIAKFT